MNCCDNFKKAFETDSGFCFVVNDLEFKFKGKNGGGELIDLGDFDDACPDCKEKMRIGCMIAALNGEINKIK